MSCMSAHLDLHSNFSGTVHQSQSCAHTDVRLQDMRCVYPLGRKLDVVELTEHDLSRLDNDEFLNDTVIDFYAK